MSRMRCVEEKIFKGKVMRVRPLSKEKFDSLVLDALRITGTYPVKNSTQEFLEPAEPGSNAWHYAQRILALEFPVFVLWETGNYEYASFNELSEVPAGPPIPKWRKINQSGHGPGRVSVKNWGNLLVMRERSTGKEFRLVRMESPSTALVVEKFYGALWKRTVDINDFESDDALLRSVLPELEKKNMLQMSLLDLEIKTDDAISRTVYRVV